MLPRNDPDRIQIAFDVTVQTWGDEVEAGTLRNNDLSTIRRLSDAFYPPSKAYVPSTLNSYPSTTIAWSAMLG